MFMVKIVYLTIDDAPSDDFRNKVDFLIQKKIPAIFFCRGNLLEKGLDNVAYAIKKGFIVGNHSYNHLHFSKISLEEAKKEIRETDKLVETAYKKSGIKRPAKIFRFPYGDKGGDNKEELQKYLKTLSYRTIKFEGVTYDYFAEYGLDKDIDAYWTYDVEEYHIKDLNGVLEKMDIKDSDRGGSLLNPNSRDIVLIYDHWYTKSIFYKAIEKMIDMKIRFELPKF